MCVCAIIGTGVSSGVSKTGGGAYREDLRNHSNTTSTRGKGVAQLRARGGRTSVGEGAATLIRIHFQRGALEFLCSCHRSPFPLMP